MNIAIVNDVAMITQLISEVITANSNHSIIWTAENGEQAISLAADKTPDMIIMDLIMPVMDGVESTRQIMKATPCAILIVTADVTYNADMVFTAMSHGAIDAISTPALGSASNQDDLKEFLYKLSIIDQLLEDSHRKPVPDVTPEEVCVLEENFPLVCIGASTGGPGALASILKQIPTDLQASIIIIQHVDEKFTSGLADWLNTQCPLNVSVAVQDDSPQAGNVYLAGGDLHLELTAQHQFNYTAEPADYAYRPSVDIFFNSVAHFWKGPSIGILLTGMGNDGANGMLALKQHHAATIAQDEDSCAVFGMPRAAIRLGAASYIKPLGDIPSCLLKLLSSCNRQVNRREATHD